MIRVFMVRAGRWMYRDWHLYQHSIERFGPAKKYSREVWRCVFCGREFGAKTA